MGSAEIGVLVAGLVGIAWVNWYFFAAERGTAVAAAGQEVRVIVQGGYSPATIRARRGVPLRLVFERRETSGCSEEVVIPDFGIRRFLPAHESTVVELVPEAVGTHEFTCGMGMLRGRLVIEEES